MADLLGSILGSMEKPPSVSNEERKKKKEQQKQIEKRQDKEKEHMQKFKNQVQKKINDFIKDGTNQKLRFEPMSKVYRGLVHEVAEVAGLTSFSFGEEEVDRFIMVWKKEFAPCDDELDAYRNGQQWNPEIAKERAKQKELDRLKRQEDAKASAVQQLAPRNDYQQKYEHIVGLDAGKTAARSTTANTNYGFVPSENKRDCRTIEQVLAENRARKKLKTSDDDTPAKTS